MSAITLEEAQANLVELVDRLAPGEEVLITRDHEPVAKLVREARQSSAPRQAGVLKGTVLFMAPDFDAPLDDFQDYME
jgi:antitoxin (DNA-binding transcriptional repressor) of toxin-antitoxin stability system